MKFKMIFQLFFSTVLLITFLFACNDPNCHGGIDVTNNSSKTIWVVSSYDNVNLYLAINRKVNPHDKYINAINTSSRCMEDNFFTKIENGILVVIIFDADAMEYNEHGRPKLNPNAILKRYDLTREDLDEMGWNIEFNI